jgi:hypothetical protein
MHNPFAPVPRAPSMLSSILPRPKPTLAETRIALQFRYLQEPACVIELRIRPGDASCEKSPPDASPKLDAPPQPVGTEELKTSQIKTPPPWARCVTRVGA